MKLSSARRCAALLLACGGALLAACANLDTISPAATELDARQGHALVSISHSGYGWLESLRVTYRRSGSVGERTVSIDPRALFRNPESGVLLRDTETRMIGELKLLSLPPGEYEFIGWSAVASYGNVGLSMVSTQWNPVDPPAPLAFSVSAGRVTYIGNLDILIPSAKRYRWRGIDARARDLALYESRFASARRGAPEIGLMRSRDRSSGEFEGAANN